MVGIDTDGTNGSTNLAAGLVDANGFNADLAQQTLGANNIAPHLQEEEAGCEIHIDLTETNVNHLHVVVVTNQILRIESSLFRVYIGWRSNLI